MKKGQCNQCGSSIGTKSLCGRCHRAQYCNKICQNLHWNIHKYACYDKEQRLNEWIDWIKKQGDCAGIKWGFPKVVEPDLFYVICSVTHLGVGEFLRIIENEICNDYEQYCTAWQDRLYHIVSVPIQYDTTIKETAVKLRRKLSNDNNLTDFPIKGTNVWILEN